MCPNPGPEPNRHRTSPLLAGCGPGGRGFESRRSPQSGLACKAAHTAASRQVRSPPRRCVHGARLLRNALVAPADLAYRNSRKALLPREARAPLPAGERSRDARTSVYARHGGCRRRRRDRRDRVLYLIPFRASRFRGVGSVEAGSAANNLGPREVLRQHAPSATRQRTLGANGIDCGASVVMPRAERLALVAPSKAPREGTFNRRRRPRFGSSGLDPRTPRCACASVPLSGPGNHRCASPSRVRAVPDCRVGGALLPVCRPRRPPFLSEP
jgi:hypothetical protein